jgi:hypothetical protein
VSEELVLLKEYIEALNMEPTKMTEQDLVTLSNALYDASEFGLARLVGGLKDPQELLDYVGEEEE